MRTTLEISEDLLRQAQAAAVLRGESLQDFVTAALRARLEAQAADAPQGRGWRSVYGQARRDEVEEIDRIVARELSGIDQDTWR